MQWFKDAKFGMFIHWGLYSKLGACGTANGIMAVASGL
ncbi:alpha-L-fucosidase [Paraflavitalea speifideaquila]